MLGVAVVAGLMLTVGIVPAVALTGMGAKGTIGAFENLPDDLKIGKLQQKTQIFAKRGGKDVLLASFYNQNRDVIGWKDVPAAVKNATLAAEDVRYYKHGGVDPMGIVRAVAVNVMHKDNQGASTITQQYVKNVCVQEAELLPTQEKVQAAYDECTGGVQRKLREARLSIGLEKQYSKDDILLGYLNITGFGGRIYGIESAAQYYFDTHAKDLTDAQAASLMAIVNNPNVLRIDDEKNLDANKVRRDYILKSELDHKMLSREDYDTAIAEKITPKITPTTTGCAGAPSGAGFFCDYVSSVIKTNAIFGKTPAERYNRLQSSGWKIYTTLDLGLQKKAKTAMTTYIPSKSPVGTNLGSAAVSVEVGTGRILSMVQNKRYDNTNGKGTHGGGFTATAVNYNTDKDAGSSGGFQPGSTYKTFTLIDWLEKGHGLNELVDGNARYIPSGEFKECGRPSAPFDVHNDEANEGGYQTVQSATNRSVNGAYASMATKLDLCDIKDRAEDLGVHRADGAPLTTNPFSILGANEVSPLTMADAYAGIANQGDYCSSVAIDRIVDSTGKDVQAPKADCHQTVPKSVAIATGYALHGVLAGPGGTAGVDRGATGSSWGFAKTGTTDDAVHTWVVGGTTKTVTAVWVGNVSGQTKLRLTYGWSSCGRAADARHCLWRDIQSANQAKYPGATSWPQPDQQYLNGAQYAVPDVTGKTVEDAKKTLLAAGFQAKTGGQEASDSIPQGMVSKTDPAAGAQANGGSTITLTKSSGPQAAPQPSGSVPSVTGMSVQDARNTLAGAGFTQVNVAQAPGATGNACQVLGQLPPAGTPADPASTPVGLGIANDPSQCG